MTDWYVGGQHYQTGEYTPYDVARDHNRRWNAISGGKQVTADDVVAATVYGGHDKGKRGYLSKAEMQRGAADLVFGAVARDQEAYLSRRRAAYTARNRGFTDPEF